MSNPSSAIGEAIFTRTDTPDFAEESMPFRTLEELAALCSQHHPGLSLERIMIYSRQGGETSTLSLGLISCSVENIQNA